MSETGEWIEHDGGPCPVSDDAIVYVEFRDGRKSKKESRARFWKAANDWWRHQGDSSDNIISYWVVNS